MPKPLPPPGVSAYCPPMLWNQPPYLDSSITPKASAAFTPSAYRVDSCCKATKPSHNVTYTDLSTQVISWSYCEAAVGPDLDLSQENSKEIKKIPENSERNSGNSQFTSYGNILNPTLHALSLDLPSVLLEKRHSWRQFTWRTGMFSPWMDYSLLRDWPITSYLRS